MPSLVFIFTATRYFKIVRWNHITNCIHTCSKFLKYFRNERARTTSHRSTIEGSVSIEIATLRTEVRASWKILVWRISKEFGQLNLWKQTVTERIIYKYISMIHMQPCWLYVRGRRKHGWIPREIAFLRRGQISMHICKCFILQIVQYIPIYGVTQRHKSIHLTCSVCWTKPAWFHNKSVTNLDRPFNI